MVSVTKGLYRRRGRSAAGQATVPRETRMKTSAARTRRAMTTTHPIIGLLAPFRLGVVVSSTLKAGWSDKPRDDSSGCLSDHCVFTVPPFQLGATSGVRPRRPREGGGGPTPRHRGESSGRRSCMGGGRRRESRSPVHRGHSDGTGVVQRGRLCLVRRSANHQSVESPHRSGLCLSPHNCWHQLQTRPSTRCPWQGHPRPLCSGPSAR